MALLDAIGKGTVPRRDLNSTVARQILAFQVPKPDVVPRAGLGHTPADGPGQGPVDRQVQDDPGVSRTCRPPTRTAAARLFGRICAQCHRLFDQGGDVGPDLTGSDRANPDYILENVLDPSATVGRDYTLTTVATRDGRLVSGILREQTPNALVIQTPSERITLPRDDVEAIKGSSTSMMPEGQLDPLTPQEVRDLFAYLAATRPVPNSPR